mmetsp:Transcript_82973/g.238466  ORF Transcript_82973/g.238466 Transcript_82973/m.238466 type:complete len:218 (+) Transcript_82973:696-1349(+)
MPGVGRRVEPQALRPADAEQEVLVRIEVHSRRVPAAAEVREDAIGHEAAEAGPIHALRARRRALDLHRELRQLFSQWHLPKIKRLLRAAVLMGIQLVQKSTERKLQLRVRYENRSAFLVSVCQTLHEHSPIAAAAPQKVGIGEVAERREGGRVQNAAQHCRLVGQNMPLKECAGLGCIEHDYAARNSITTQTRDGMAHFGHLQHRQDRGHGNLRAAH